MKKTSNLDLMTTRFRSSTHLSFTTNRLGEIISSNRYSTDDIKKIESTIPTLSYFNSYSSEIDSKTKKMETKAGEISESDEKTRTDSYSHLTYQITMIPNHLNDRKMPTYIILLASIPSFILICLILPYLIIKFKNLIRKQRLRRRSRIVRDSGMIEMSSVINDHYMATPERYVLFFFFLKTNKKLFKNSKKKMDFVLRIMIFSISNCSNYLEPRCCSDQMMEQSIDENSIFLGIMDKSIFSSYIYKM